MYIGSKLVDLRKKKSLTQDEMAEILGIKRARYNAWENDIAKPDIEMLSKIADFHKVSTDYLLGRTEDRWSNISYVAEPSSSTYFVAESHSFYDSKPNGIPLVGTICAGDGLLAKENIEEYVRYPFPSKRQPDYALKVKGNSMIGAGIEDGDIVFMRKAKWAEYNGQIVAAIINGEEGTLKRIKWSLESPVITLLPENEEYPPIEVLPNEVYICGVYAGHFRPELENR